MRAVLIAVLIVATAAQITINFPNSVILSNYNTLVSNVAYTINMTFDSAITIPSGSYFLLQLSQHFIINSTTVGLCKYHITGSSYTTVSCNTNYNVNNAAYEISVMGIYALTANSQTAVNLLVRSL
jgi:hypothetical protein